MCEKHRKIAEVSICYNDLRYEKITLTHNHNCLMGTITFKVHSINPTSPRIHACNHI